MSADSEPLVEMLRSLRVFAEDLREGRFLFWELRLIWSKSICWPLFILTFYTSYLLVYLLSQKLTFNQTQLYLLIKVENYLVLSFHLNYGLVFYVHRPHCILYCA